MNSIGFIVGPGVGQFGVGSVLEQKRFRAALQGAIDLNCVLLLHFFSWIISFALDAALSFPRMGIGGEMSCLLFSSKDNFHVRGQKRFFERNGNSLMKAVDNIIIWRSVSADNESEESIHINSPLCP
jgi:hypothetical protein